MRKKAKSKISRLNPRGRQSEKKIDAGVPGCPQTTSTIKKGMDGGLSEHWESWEGKKRSGNKKEGARKGGFARKGKKVIQRGLGKKKCKRLRWGCLKADIGCAKKV